VGGRVGRGLGDGAWRHVADAQASKKAGL